MEIEKKRETSWRFLLKDDENRIQLTSVEISGEVRLIRLAILNDDQKFEVELNKDEFFNFLSLISAFKDVVIGDSSYVNQDGLDIILNGKEDFTKYSNQNSNSSDENFNDEDVLDPKDWDPW
ncbi:MAG: hypothetical protein GF317_01390 [Candidatus Lokiarchaeota archaeon]|nr:hypothetical protein [Candidatus Lokiarchaeota archaeon]MBD3198598.1 hypothetical protein [Candidatus Lokiarchaeota archaeon]